MSRSDPRETTLPGDATVDHRLDSISYVMPLRRWAPVPAPDSLTDYLRWLSVRVEVIVVDGSAADLFSQHHDDWADTVTHVRVDPELATRNGKVGGVMTGLRLATHETVVIADDDVRYDERALRVAARSLHRWDLVRPQNYFTPLPWHARWDTARSLINRAFGGDYPGTFVVRRSTLLAVGGYSGAVLFENLELLRTMNAAGARVANRPDLFVRRLPPTRQDFVAQRVRHAFESMAQPGRLLVELALLPTITGLAVAGRWRELAGLTAVGVGLAEFGRRRHGGRSVFTSSSALLAPAWAMERAVCIWIALWLRCRGGIAYADATFPLAGHSARSLVRGHRRLRADDQRRASLCDCAVLDRDACTRVDDVLLDADGDDGGLAACR